MEVIIRPNAESAVKLTAKLIADSLRAKPDTTIGLATGRTMEAPVQAQGLAPGFEASFSPEAVDVVLSGPLAQLQNLVPDDIEIRVNLVDLAPGTHRLTPTVVVPAGIELKGVLPESVEVQITAVEPAEPAATVAPG